MKTNMTIGKESSVKAWSRRVLMALAVGGAMLSGCTEEENKLNNDKEKGETFTFTAVAPTGSMTKAVWDAEPNATTGKLGFNWEDSDKKMDLWQSGTTITEADMSVNADDRSIVTITAESINKEKEVFAFFPSGKVMIDQGDLTLPVLMLQPELTQMGATTDHLRDYMFLAGALTTEELQSDEIPPMQLAHLCAVLRFKVQNGTNESVRVTKVEMLATEEDKGVNMLYALIAAAAPSNITVNVQDADDETKGHLLAAGGALSVYSHCFSTEVNDGQFRFRVTVTDADGGNPRVFYTKEEFSVNGITTTKSNDATQKVFQPGYYYTFNLDISKIGDGERFNTIYTWNASTVASESLKGEGTEESPYLISNARDLQWLIANVGNSNGGYYKLTTDIIIESDEENPWTPIGSSTNAFNGTFDGNNHTISGAMVGTEQFFGFFGYTNKATIQNLTVNANVTGGESSDITPSRNTGGIVGYATGKTTFTDCIYNGTVTGGSTTNGVNFNTGGILGCNYYGDLTFTDCINNGVVTGGKTVNCEHKTNGTGGIVGSANTTITFTNCTNNGKVTGGTTSGTYAYCYTGGIAGSAYSDKNTAFTKCTNNGMVIGGTSQAYACYTGGIVGIVKGTLTECTNNNTVTGGTGAGNYGQSITGGIVGHMYNDGSVLKSCTNKSTGVVTAGTSGSYGNGSITGGLVGDCGDENVQICICCKDESNYTENGTAKPIGKESKTQEQVEGCSGTHE